MEIKETLKNFISTSALHESCQALLDQFAIKYVPVSPANVPIDAFLLQKFIDSQRDLVAKIKEISVVGVATQDTFMQEDASAVMMDDVDNAMQDERYENMAFFSIDTNVSLTRTEIALLTRAFNRRMLARPVVLFLRYKHLLSLATCERSAYIRANMEGEKAGKVYILRNINLENTHSGHIEILSNLECGDCTSFEQLYQKWMKVFNTDILTKKFYDDLFNWYQWVLDPNSNVHFPGNLIPKEDVKRHEDKDTSVIRLITRLMFVWFIKQKGLVPDKIFEAGYISTILKDFDANSTTSSNYYQAILQNLFFGTLNRPIEEDGEVRTFKSDPDVPDSKNLYRYEDLFTISKEDVISLFSKVPFLNCGLFECQDKNKKLDGKIPSFFKDGFTTNDTLLSDGSYKNRAVVPNIYFFDERKGLFSIFNKYVFTIEENTPQDVQVALDPELLGKVFENLLGVYNPETQETARNQSGSFYTPREIVQYMVDESLIAHLKHTVGGDLEQKYRELLDFTTDNVDLTEEQRLKIIHSLFTCKILDPACGSGAFPMGMLQQMVHILQQVDPDNRQWRHVLERLSADDSYKAFGIKDEEERNTKLQEIRDTFNNALNSPDYTRKLYIIESCIYGVDIQPIAMLITRLRFFITLICEQNEILFDHPEKNFGIKTLPNLESKFVAANTLIDADIHKYNEDWTQDEVLIGLKNELISIRRHHFYTRKSGEKRKLLVADEKKREEIHNHIKKLVGEPNEKKIAALKEQIRLNEELLELYQGENWVEEAVHTNLFSEPEIIKVDRNKRERDRINAIIKQCKSDIEREYHKSEPQGFNAAVLQVTEWNPYDQNEVSPFLDIEWMFGITDGFDIVIGNPPYIQLQANGGELAKLYEQCGYETFKNTGDIYCLFYERGRHLLKSNANLCYITSNKWMRAGYGKLLRSFFTTKTQPKMMIDFAETHVFDSACVMTNIILLAKQNYATSFQCVVVGDEDSKEAKNLPKYVLEHSVATDFDSDESWVVRSDMNKSIRSKIAKKGKKLANWDINIFRGLLSGYDKAFVINTEKRNEILSSCKTSDERMRTEALILPMLRGKDIVKYGDKWQASQIWLINTHNGVKGKFKRINIDDYPAVKKHLDNHIKKLVNRSDQGDTPYNLRNCAYLEEFDKPKIIYPNMTKYLPFTYEEKKVYVNAKCYIITGNHLSSLIAFFNSSLFKYCYKDDFPVLFGGARELQKVYFDQIPVIEVDDTTEEEFHSMVVDIQKEYSEDKAKKIDQKIFDLYGLSQLERDTIGYIDYHSTNEIESDDYE